MWLPASFHCLGIVCNLFGVHKTRKQNTILYGIRYHCIVFSFCFLFVSFSFSQRLNNLRHLNVMFLRFVCDAFQLCKRVRLFVHRVALYNKWSWLSLKLPHRKTNTTEKNKTGKNHSPLTSALPNLSKFTRKLSNICAIFTMPFSIEQRKKLCG